MNNMKQKSLGMMSILLAFGLYGQEAKVTVHVTDENGIAISNAQAVAQFQNALKPGEGQGTGRPTEVRGLTDTNGLCVLTGNGTDGSVGIGILKEGYYYGNAEVSFTNGDHILNRWLPWNPQIEVVMLKKGVQVPMYARRVSGKIIPIEGKPVGFDLIACDWVAPYGKGKTPDFIFEVEIEPTTWITNWYGTSPRPYPLQDNKMTIGFSNNGDGIQQAVASGYALRLARQAPSDKYESSLIKTQYDEIISVESQNTKVQQHIKLDKGQNYFFRVRTKKDAQGNIVSALYGKLYGEFNNGSGIGEKISFTYYLNPEPNSRNMEFDPGQNLFKNLPPLERVTAP